LTPLWQRLLALAVQVNTWSHGLHLDKEFF
jgi:hypothetical protein